MVTVAIISGFYLKAPLIFGIILTGRQGKCHGYSMDEAESIKGSDVSQTMWANNLARWIPTERLSHIHVKLNGNNFLLSPVTGQPEVSCVSVHKPASTNART